MAFYIDCLNEDEADDESRSDDENMISTSVCLDGLEDDDFLTV
jgi:hypothetical protein